MASTVDLQQEGPGLEPLSMLGKFAGLIFKVKRLAFAKITGYCA